MRNFINIFFLLSLLFSCSSRKEVVLEEKINVNSSISEVKNKIQMEEAKGKSVTVYGTIIQEDFVNKAGKSTGIKETLLKLEDGETVHLRNKGDSTYFYPDLVNKKVKMTAVIFYGGIDSDNPEHQSRIGYRIDYTLITEID